MNTLHSTNTQTLCILGFVALKCNEVPTHILCTQYSWLFKYSSFIFMINQCYSWTVPLRLVLSPVRSFHAPFLFVRASSACYHLSCLLRIDHFSSRHVHINYPPANHQGRLILFNLEIVPTCVCMNPFLQLLHMSAPLFWRNSTFGTLNTFAKAQQKQMNVKLQPCIMRILPF